MTFDEWYDLGQKKGYCSEGFCDTHDGHWNVLSDEERDEWEEGGDPCLPVVRCYPS
jgi:hypothetical protein